MGSDFTFSLTPHAHVPVGCAAVMSERERQRESEREKEKEKENTLHETLFLLSLLEAAVTQ